MNSAKVLLLHFLAGFYLGSCEWIPDMENPGLLEGDILLDPDERPQKNNGFASIKGGRWPNAIIPYTIDNLISQKVRDNIPNAIEQYERNTCIRFKKRTTEKEYIRFYRGDGCHSPVGYRKYRRNDVSLSYGCSRVGTIIHEIGHSIGLYHEQSRPDRNTYVKILWENIEPKMEYNFNKYYYSTIDSLGTPYDYLSIMHYGRTAFGRGKVTIEAKDPLYRYRIGRRNGFSAIDIKQINLMYCNGVNPTNIPTIPSTTIKSPKPTGNGGKCTDEWSGELCAFYIVEKNCKESDLVRTKCCQACREKWGIP